MKLRMSCATVAAFTVLAGPAAAADFGGNCCADLEERIAELEATTARKGNRKVSLEVSGHVNEAILFWDDGGSTTTEKSNTYVGTNDTARTRFRFKGDAKITGDWKAGYLIEIGVRANRLTRTSQDSDEGGTALDLRKSAWFVENKQYGKVWLGITGQSADGITEINLANMNHFARLSASKFNMSNFIIFNRVRSDRRWRDLLPADGFTGDNVPGEGDRHSLIKYESPSFAGFDIELAWGEDDFWDVALRYKGEFGGFKLAAGIAYAEYTDANIEPSTGLNESLRGCAVPGTGQGNNSDPSSDNQCSQLGGSVSIMHVDTGLFATAAAGMKDDDLRDRLFQDRPSARAAGNIDEKDWFWGIQGGIEKKFMPLGKTTMYGEYAKFQAGAQIGDTDGSRRSFNAAFPSLGTGSNLSAGSEVRFWGLGINQQFESAALDLYLAFRHYEGEVTLFDDNVGNTGGRATFDVQDIDIVMSGAKISF